MSTMNQDLITNYLTGLRTKLSNASFILNSRLVPSQDEVQLLRKDLASTLDTLNNLEYVIGQDTLGQIALRKELNNVASQILKIMSPATVINMESVNGSNQT